MREKKNTVNRGHSVLLAMQRASHALLSDQSSNVKMILLDGTTPVNTFTSPSYPHNFPLDVDACWVQTPTEGHAVNLTFTDFEVRTLILVNCLLLFINVFLAVK